MSNAEDKEVQQLEQIIFNTIAYAGEGKGLAYEALSASEKGKFEEAKDLIKQSNDSLVEAHHVQTDLIQKEAAGQSTPVSMLFIHSQDHIMTAISEIKLIEKLIKLNERLFKLENK